MSRLSQLRMARYDGGDGDRQNNEDGKGCTDVLKEWKNFNSSGDKAVPGVGDDVDESESSKTITSLNKLNNKYRVSYSLFFLLLVCVFSPSLEADIGSCAKESSRQDVSITLTIVKIRSGIAVRILLFILDIFRFYVFWMGWFQITVVEVKIITLEISFGSSPSPSPSPVIFPPDWLLIYDKPPCF